ncbi:DUF4347 domain-containing protein [Oscillatoria sp. CS-180]|uniref:DUF4347 domain-containing protein n=1 Tax=Oscillatoria sp. CS-180 TaxID=3021720 RepID=UPI00232EC357|nr:DUF4347 domain-containing protein [Oscillatoria sp. CS-180]MDB9529034.1 DUF4347 domain-containing protein [Oscillatoria sp. CS-180]
MANQIVSTMRAGTLAHPSPKSWIIVDSNIDDLQILLDIAVENNDVFLLDNTQDGVEQITSLLRSTNSAPEALHLVSHGAPGTLSLGNSELSLSTLNHYSEQLKSWPIRDLFIYGCNVAAGDAGEEFLQKIQSLTQANIAASTHKVGHRTLGATWNLDVELGHVQASSFVTPALADNYFGSFVTEVFVQTEDNASNGGVPGADGDFGKGIRIGANSARNTNTGQDLGAIQPIEFFINTGATDAIVGEALLFLSVFDVDAPREANLVTFNGTELGLLEGENELTFRSVFRVPNELVLSGNNLVQIDINVLGDAANWEAEIERAELVVNYESGATAPGGSAFLDTIDTDQPTYEGGDTVQLRADIDTTVTPNQNVEIQAILRDPNGMAVAFDTRPESSNVLITGNDDADAFTWDVDLPDDAVPGTWSIDVSVFNIDTGQLELLATDTFVVGTVAGDNPVSVFQFKDFVRFEEMDEGIPYQGGNAEFNEQVYLLTNPDIQAAVNNGVFSNGGYHYSFFGASEGRSTLPLNLEIGGLKIASLFDETYYLGLYGDVDTAVAAGDFIYGFEHFVKFGVLEGRNPSLYYDEATYLANNGDVATAVNSGSFSSGLEHYLAFGHREERDPSTLFDASDYLLSNPDVLAAVNAGDFDSGFDHYIEHGASEGRINTLLYEEAFYLNTFPDVANAVNTGTFPTGFEHYVPFGQGEARDPGPLFDESAYLGSNPDVATAIAAGQFSSGMEHYFRFGRQEGRPAEPISTAV